MGIVTINVSFQDSLLAEIDNEAKRESRSRSELLREATRLYMRRQKQWEDVFTLGEQQSTYLGLTEDDVSREIAHVRKNSKRKS